MLRWLARRRLAGLRIGYGVMDPELADYIERVRQPYNVNAIAQAAASRLGRLRERPAGRRRSKRSIRRVGLDQLELRLGAVDGGLAKVAADRPVEPLVRVLALAQVVGEHVEAVVRVHLALILLGGAAARRRPGLGPGKFPALLRFVFAVFIWGKVGQICLAMSFYPHLKNHPCVMFNVSDPTDTLEGNSHL